VGRRDHLTQLRSFQVSSGSFQVGAGSFQVGADEVDQVFGELGSNLLFGAIDQVEADVGFEDFAHEAVDTAAHGSKKHELCAAIFIGEQGALDGVELAAEFADALEEFKLFSFLVGHEGPPVDNTHPRYGI